MNDILTVILGLPIIKAMPFLFETKLIILFVLIFIQSNVVPYVIQPKIYSSKIDLSIMWVLFGILTGSTLFGAWGMIIAMPILVTIKISYRVYRQHNPQPKNA